MKVKKLSDNFNINKIFKHFCGNLDLLLENLTDPFLGQLITNIQEEIYIFRIVLTR